jgi:hypothetical protein
MIEDQTDPVASIAGIRKKVRLAVRQGCWQRVVVTVRY